jgi:DNA polymerase III gamma/tau subunit
MNKERIAHTIETLKSGGQSAPLLVSEETVCTVIRDIFGIEETSIEDIKDKSLTDFLWYDCADKKSESHKVKFVREFVEKLYQKPVGEIFVVLFLNIEILTPESYNALLNIFEEVPQRLLILVTSQTPEKIIPTLQSRIISLDTEGIHRGENPFQETIDSFVLGRPE